MPQATDSHPKGEDPAWVAYGALLDHLSTCADCTDATGCAAAQKLRRTYKALRRQGQGTAS
ncbi:hypothetical protein ACWEQ3_30215 [Streptomyces mirabilis]